jgi:hypothetical protein
MYFTDRGIEELGQRRGEDQVTLGWLATRFQRRSSTCIPSSTSRSTGWPAGWLVWTARTTSTTSRERRRRPRRLS